METNKTTILKLHGHGWHKVPFYLTVGGLWGRAASLHKAQTWS